MLTDTFGRVATDLRVSLTDRCNLRCTYCMPAEGLEWLPGDEVLTDDEVVRAHRASRSTSASPRCGSPAASRCCAAGWSASSPRRRAASPGREISLTTNGIGLARLAGRAARRRPRPGQRLASTRSTRRRSRR